jgi:hypothetical protein
VRLAVCSMHEYVSKRYRGLKRPGRETSAEVKNYMNLYINLKTTYKVGTLNNIALKVKLPHFVIHRKFKVLYPKCRGEHRKVIDENKCSVTFDEDYCSPCFV